MSANIHLPTVTFYKQHFGSNKQPKPEWNHTSSKFPSHRLILLNNNLSIIHAGGTCLLVWLDWRDVVDISLPPNILKSVLFL